MAVGTELCGIKDLKIENAEIGSFVSAKVVLGVTNSATRCENSRASVLPYDPSCSYTGEATNCGYDLHIRL